MPLGLKKYCPMHIHLHIHNFVQQKLQTVQCKHLFLFRPTCL